MAGCPAQSFGISGSSAERHTLIPTSIFAEEDMESTPRPANPLHKFFKLNKGLFIIAASQFLFSLTSLSVKFLTALDKPVPIFEIAAARMVITYMCCQIYMLASGIANPILGPKGVRKWLILRGIAGFIAVSGLYYSLQYLPLSDATVLTFLKPTITAVLGFLLLQEALSWKQVVAGFFSLIGVTLIAKPTFIFGEHLAGGAGGSDVSEAQHMLAVGVSFVGALGASCAYITIRVVGKRAHALHILSYFSLWSVLVSVTIMAVTHTEWVLPSQWAWLGMLFVVGFIGFLAQVLLTIGLQLETASRGSMVMYTQIVFSLVFERIVFGVSPSGLSLVGTCMIIASTIYVAMKKPPKEPSIPLDTESAVIWNSTPAAEEGRRLLDGVGREEYTEPHIKKWNERGAHSGMENTDGDQNTTRLD